MATKHWADDFVVIYDDTGKQRGMGIAMDDLDLKIMREHLPAGWYIATAVAR